MTKEISVNVLGRRVAELLICGGECPPHTVHYYAFLLIGDEKHEVSRRLSKADADKLNVKDKWTGEINGVENGYLYKIGQISNRFFSKSDIRKELEYFIRDNDLAIDEVWMGDDLVWNRISGYRPTPKR